MSWWAGIEFLLSQRGDGRFYVGKPVVMEAQEPAVASDPTFRLDMEQAQTLMDDLWNCGLRPTEGAGSAGALAATQRHLDDMRRLVFDRETFCQSSPKPSPDGR